MDFKWILNRLFSGEDHQRRKLTIAHVADSAAALGTKSGEKWLGKFVTRDHKPNMKGERERMRSCMKIQ